MSSSWFEWLTGEPQDTNDVEEQEQNEQDDRSVQDVKQRTVRHRRSRRRVGGRGRQTMGRRRYNKNSNIETE